jgi:hypothetical protein
MSSDNQNRTHRFERYTMRLDWSEPTTRLKQRFSAWLKAHEPQGIKKRSNRGHHKPAEWLWWLTYYRLSKLSLAKREITGQKLGKEISGSQICRGKKRILKLMRFRNYQ